jgi:uncharacterized protein YecT (DUF1311 family)
MLTERQPRFFRAAFALVAYAALSHSYAGEATHDVQNVPSAIIGQWQVSAAHVDRLATRTQQYDEGDPRLVGRIFTFSPNALENNTADDSDTCPVATVLRLDRNSLFEKSFGERLTGPRFVASDDFGIGYSIAPTVAVVSVSCQGKIWNGGIGAAGGLQGSWIIMQSSDVALMHWYDDTLLTLTRLPASALPNPSFECKAAISKAERTICSSFQLAGFDRSVSLAYHRALTDVQSSGDTSRRQELVQSQVQWLKMRNNCERNEMCLSNAMSARLQELHDMQ